MMGGVCHVLIFPRVPGSLVGKCGAGTWDGKTNTGPPGGGDKSRILYLGH